MRSLVLHTEKDIALVRISRPERISHTVVSGQIRDDLLNSDIARRIPQIIVCDLLSVGMAEKAVQQHVQEHPRRHAGVSGEHP